MEHLQFIPNAVLRMSTECPTSFTVATNVAAVVFAVVAGWTALRFLSFCWRHLMRPRVNLRKYGAGHGAWAVVTGATDGIGKAYAQQLAKSGFNVALVSRSADRLNATAKEIKEASPKVNTAVYAMDFSTATDSDFENLKVFLGKLGDVGCLVNNVGISYEMPTPFHLLDLPRVRALVAINVRATTEVTHSVLPMMVEKKRGLIINISSISSLFPSPLLSVYGASKAYVNHWSNSIAAEYASYGIHVEVQTPSFVTSKLSKIRHSSLSVPTATTYVRTALSKAGHDSQTNPHLMHDLMSTLLGWLPTSTSTNLVHKELKGTRARALKKAGKTV